MEVTRSLPVPDWQDRLRDQAGRASIRNLRILMLVTLFGLLAWWTLDGAIVASGPAMMRRLARIRIACSVYCVVALVVVREQRWWRDRPALTSWLFTVGLVVMILIFGHPQIPSGQPLFYAPWYFFIALSSCAMLIPLPHRIWQGLSLTFIAVLVFAWLEHDAQAPFPLFLTGSIVAFLAVTAVVVGHIVYLLYCRMLQLTWAVAQRNREVQLANSHLSRLTETLEDAVRERTRDLQELARHHLAEQEKERAAIARDIHDDMGQLIAAMQMELYYLSLTPRTGSPEANASTAEAKASTAEAKASTAEAKASTDRLLRLLDGFSDLTRRALLRLRPRILDDLGLVPALDWLCRTVARDTTMAIVTQLPEGDSSCSAEAALAAFRIGQEALGNALKHSQGSEVQVTLHVTGDQMLLEVADDGIGLPEERTGNGTRFGLLGMSERALSAGGSLEFAKRPGGGTVVRLRVARGASPELPLERP